MSFQNLNLDFDKREVQRVSLLTAIPGTLTTHFPKEQHMSNTTYKATCMKVTCRYTEHYDRHPGAPRCPKCGSPMMVQTANR